MIYTLTANPSLDYIVNADIIPGAVNRSRGETLYPGGKGINVSVMLERLGSETTAVLPVAGKTGEILEDMLKGVAKTSFIRLDSGMTRINVKVIGENGETEINGKGVSLPAAEFKRRLIDVSPEDILVISGSFADYGIVKEISDYVNTDKVVIDIPRIKYALDCRPFVIKPNITEMEEYFGEVMAKDEIPKYTQRLLEMGCRNVLVSLGADGAYFGNKNFGFYVPAPQGKCLSSIGAGDSMLAGLIYGIIKGMPVEDSVKLAVACGSATAFCGHLAELDDVLKLYENM